MKMRETEDEKFTRWAEQETTEESNSKPEDSNTNYLK